MRKRRWGFPLLVMVLLAGLIALFAYREDLRNPFERYLPFASPSYATADASGNRYVIDSSLTRVVRLNERGEVTLLLNGGAQSERDFFYVENVAADAEGNIYLTDTRIANDQTTVERERILRFTSNGRFDGVLYERDYTQEDAAPKMYGWLSGLSARADGHVYCAIKDDRGLAALCDGEELFRLDYPEANVYFEDVRVLEDLSGLLVTRKDGGVWLTDRENLLRAVYTGHDEKENGSWSIPMEACEGGDGAYYLTDLGTREILRLSAAEDTETVLPRRGAAEGVRFGASPIYYRLDCAGGILAATDTFSALFYDLQSGETLFDGEGAPLGNGLRLWRGFVWLLALICLLLLALLLYLLLRGRPRRAPSPLFKKGLLILVVAGAVAVLVGYMMINESQKQLDEEILQSIATMTQMATSFVEGDDLEAVKKLSDFRQPAYMRLKERMDAIMREAYAAGSNPYYLFYMTDGETVYRVMDYIDFVSPHMPMDTAYPGSYYEEVMVSGRQQAYGAIADSTGVWTLAVGPIYNSRGEAIAVVEIGRNLYSLKADRQAVILELIRNVLAMVVVLLLLSTEILYIAEMFKRQRELRALPRGERYLDLEIVRPLVFLLLIADYMQNGFEPIYVSQLYQGLWGLPQSIGIGIPLSSEVVSTALFAVVAGYLRDKMGLRRLLTLGVTLGGLGILLRGMATDIPLFILGKVVTGAGMGGVFVALNTFVAERRDPEKVNAGFALYFAGSLSAINVGIVLGSTLAGFVGYQNVYRISGALLLLLGLLTLTLVRGNLEPRKRAAEKAPEARSRLGMLRFLANPRVFAFQFLLFIPYLALSYFLYYFYPLFASEQGLSDAVIGQTFLLNGLCVIYLGPWITPPLLRALGARLASLLGGALYIAGLALFALNPSLASAIACIVVMGVADSFSFSAMTVCYTQTEAVARYGESRASGVKSTMENVGYTVAPFAYGAALMLGTTTGLLVMAGAFGGCLALFALITMRKERGKA